ncbi:hypothetical protein AYM40_25475 [Paraburkholderia phytofirmans OLGA172]|uniref:Uncharacterized protein n=1 Tax=Paraburkholderia phytofirmans OLGA172 TaxID=1417228 RepID=A0A161HZI5_9BURK|nr:DUF4136 domain-containing protein [Paraburkholderia phytofirmans]ANB75687.1 hypothetical protein AYM40_25475 [Paraburkholderia phytofirmans OLGA172]
MIHEPSRYRSEKLVKAISICAVLAAASLTGCAGLNADVHTANPSAVLQGERTYAIARMPSQDASADYPQFETMLRDELAKNGFIDTVDTAGKSAHYLLSIAYDTRPATVGVGAKDCVPGACERSPEAPFSLFGGRAYQHALTLRFFERSSGQEVYKVSAASSDRDPDPLHAMPVLVKSALAKFPFDAPPDWRVKLRTETTGGVPEVVSLKPVQRLQPQP